MGTLCDASRLGQIEEFALARTQGLIGLVAEGHPPGCSPMRRKHLSGFRRVYVGGRALLCRAAVAEQAMSKDRCAVNRGHGRGRRRATRAPRAARYRYVWGDIQRAGFQPIKRPGPILSNMQLVTAPHTHTHTPSMEHTLHVHDDTRNIYVVSAGLTDSAVGGAGQATSRFSETIAFFFMARDCPSPGAIAGQPTGPGRLTGRRGQGRSRRKPRTCHIRRMRT